ncbi:MAG: CpaF family protein [Acidimicrobiia bacterium]
MSAPGTVTSAPPTDAEIKAVVHRRLLAGAANHDAAVGSVAEGPVRERLATLLGDTAPLLRPSRRVRLVDELVAEVTGLGPLEPHLADPDVTEVMINGPGCAYVERNGRIEPIALDLDADAIRRLVERVVGPLGLRLDRASPIVDARLPDGSRLHAALPPLAIDGPCVTIRRFSCRRVSLASFALGPIGEEFLADAVAGGWNIVVAGGTSAGKTTLLNALSTAIPAHERIITVEETAELQLERRHVVRLEARPPNAEGAGGVTVRELVRAALRMRPDRIVVGEVRGGEAFDMLQALNTGHDGSLTTVHANGVREALHRLETLVLLADTHLPIGAVRMQLATSVDAVVHVARAGDGARAVTGIAEVAAPRPGDQHLSVRVLFEAVADGLDRVAASQRPFRRAELSAAPPAAPPRGSPC